MAQPANAPDSPEATKICDDARYEPRRQYLRSVLMAFSERLSEMRFLSAVVYLLLVILVVSASASLPFGLVALVYREQLTFSPSRFINDGFGFILAVLAASLGFLLSDVYWHYRIEREQIARLSAQLRRYLQHSARIVFEANAAIDPQREQTNDERTKMDIEALANLRRLGDMHKFILALLDRSEVTWIHDKSLRDAGDYFRTDVSNLFERLAQRPSIRPGAEEISQDLETAGHNLKALLAHLEEK